MKPVSIFLVGGGGGGVVIFSSYCYEFECTNGWFMTSVLISILIDS
jgi:hypothetical protein